MDYEQKYKDALERAKKYYNERITLGHTRDAIKEIFPEVKDDENERIKNSLIRWFKDCDSPYFAGFELSKILDWLEKQGKEEYDLKSFKDEDVRKFMQYIEKEAKAYEFNLPNRGYDIYAFAKDILYWLEKQGERKAHLCQEDVATKGYAVTEPEKYFKGASTPLEATAATYTTEVETGNGGIKALVMPKFKVGDWIVNNNSGSVYQVTEIRDDKYCLWPPYAEIMGYLRIIDVDNDYRLWTIEDAKPGDVLVNGANIFIFHFINDTRLMGYCHVNTDDGRFYDDIGKNECFCLIDSVVYPVTKEQRDLLFKKMKEAGYEWNAEKKELKIIDWSKHIKYEPNSPSITEETPVWSEEDERMRQETIDWFEKKCFPYALESENPARESIKWLKSLKERYTWKPSDEQMEALKDGVRLYKSTHFDSEHYKIESLHEDLKKLKGE